MDDIGKETRNTAGDLSSNGMYPFIGAEEECNNGLAVDPAGAFRLSQTVFEVTVKPPEISRNCLKRK